MPLPGEPSQPAPSVDDRFAACAAIVIDRFEGGDKLTTDDGGVTRFGIAQKYNPDVNVRELTREKALELYRARYWDPLRCGEMPPALGFLVFDCGVNPGPGAAAEMLQDELRVERDGVIGPDTLEAAKHAALNDLLVGLTSRRIAYYVNQVQRYPYKREWINGWYRRACRALTYATRML